MKGSRWFVFKAFFERTKYQLMPIIRDLAVWWKPSDIHGDELAARGAADSRQLTARQYSGGGSGSEGKRPKKQGQDNDDDDGDDDDDDRINTMVR